VELRVSSSQAAERRLRNQLQARGHASASRCSDNLDRLPERGEQGADRAGCGGHPRAKGSRTRGFGGALRLRLLSARVGARATSRAACCRSMREARPGCGSPRRAFAACAALGRGSAATGLRRGSASPVSCRLVARDDLARTLARSSGPARSRGSAVSAQTPVIQEDDSRESAREYRRH
jgi:hypothetical protein